MLRRLPFWVAGLALATVVSCGSKTGLFGPDIDGLLPDGGLADGGSPDGGDEGGVPCIPGRFAFELATAQLMFVIDRSGSMAFSLSGQDPPPPGEQSRWRILRDALDTTILPFDGQMAMGAKFFPEVLTAGDLADSERSCRTDSTLGIAPARNNVGQILQVFDTTEPRGGTPTSEALRIAALQLIARRQVARTIVVATDGAPNCNGGLDAQTCLCTTPRLNCGANPDRGRFSCLDDIRTIATIKDIAETKKIPVYVIGIGSTERPEFLRVLDDMAVAGGRPRPAAPRHYNVQSSGELNSALTTIRDSVAKCTYLTPSSPLDPDQITVEINGKIIARDPTRTNGWDWVDQSYGELAFFGAACEAAGGGTAKVTGVVSCEPKD